MLSTLIMLIKIWHQLLMEFDCLVINGCHSQWETEDKASAMLFHLNTQMMTVWNCPWLDNSPAPKQIPPRQIRFCDGILAFLELFTVDWSSSLTTPETISPEHSHPWKLLLRNLPSTENSVLPSMGIVWDENCPAKGKGGMVPKLKSLISFSV